MSGLWWRLGGGGWLAALAAVAAVGATAPEEVEVAATVPTCLHLRAAADGTARARDCLAPGTRAVAVTAGPEWTRLRLADGREGWVISRYLRSVGRSTAASAGEPGTAAEPSGERDRLAPFEPAAAGRPVVRRGTFRQRTLLTGELRAARATPIVVPRTSAWSVELRWLAEDGAEVEAGDRVAEFDNSSLVSELEDLRLSTVESADRLARARIEAEQAAAESRLAVDRAYVELRKAEIAADIPEGLLSQREYQERQLARLRAAVTWEKAQEDLQAQQAASSAELALQRVDLEKAERRMAAIERDLEALSLTAPESGLVLVERHLWEERKFAVGDTTWPGMTILTLPDLTSLEVEAQLIDVDDGRIEVGRPALCRLDAYPDEVVACAVAEVTPVAQAPSTESQRRAFRVRLELERSDPERMRPGMSVRVEVESRRLEDVLLAPRPGLDLAAEPPRAFLAGGGIVEVELGPCAALECVVAEGLEEGAVLRAPAEAGP